MKYEGDIAFLGRQKVDASRIDVHSATGGGFQAGDDAQERRLAATRRTEQDAKFAFSDAKRNLFQDPRRAERDEGRGGEEDRERTDGGRG